MDWEPKSLCCSKESVWRTIFSKYALTIAELQTESYRPESRIENEPTDTSAPPSDPLASPATPESSTPPALPPRAVPQRSYTSPHRLASRRIALTAGIAWKQEREHIQAPAPPKSSAALASAQASARHSAALRAQDESQFRGCVRVWCKQSRRRFQWLPARASVNQRLTQTFRRFASLCWRPALALRATIHLAPACPRSADVPLFRARPCTREGRRLREYEISALARSPDKWGHRRKVRRLRAGCCNRCFAPRRSP